MLGKTGINISRVGRDEFIEKAKEALKKLVSKEVDDQNKPYEDVFSSDTPLDVLVRSQLDNILESLPYQKHHFLIRNQEIPNPQLDYVIGKVYDEFMNTLNDKVYIT